MLSFGLAFTVLFSVQLCIQSVAAIRDKWQLNDLTTNFMGDTSGLPDPAWPEPAKFNSSISFSVEHFTGGLARYDPPKHIAASCGANWTPGDTPVNWLPCQVKNSIEKITWRFVPQTYRSEHEFSIELLGIRIALLPSYMHLDSIVIATGSLQVTANDPTVPSSYLTCLGGAPLTGITCKTNGTLSSGRTPIQMVAGEEASNTRTIPAFNVRSLQANPYASTNHQSCVKQVLMEITQQHPTQCLVEWPCQAAEPTGVNQCQNNVVDDSIAFSINARPGESLFDGFTLGLKRTYPVTVRNITLTVQMNATKDFRLDNELVRDCGTSGHDRCVIKTKGRHEIRPEPANIDISY